jgi:site-specific DNA-methyltransferase (adenine-specific)
MRLIHGDCLEAMRALPAGSVDAVIADPPYGTTACKWDAVIPFAPMWEQLRRVAKPNAAIVLFASQPFTSALVMSNPREFRYEWVWDKILGGNPLNAPYQPHKVHETVCVFSQSASTYSPRGTMRYFPQMTEGEPYHKGRPERIAKEIFRTPVVRRVSINETGDRYPRSIIPFSNAGRVGKVHPTQKPVDLMAYLVRTYTNPGETVLDFCMGSGTTGVAALQEGRDFIGIEREAAYFQIAERRIAAAQPPLFAAAD